MTLRIAAQDLHDLRGARGPRPLLHGLPIRDRLLAGSFEDSEQGLTVRLGGEVDHEPTAFDALIGPVAGLDAQFLPDLLVDRDLESLADDIRHIRALWYEKTR